jgi:hypothetical protein
LVHTKEFKRMYASKEVKGQQIDAAKPPIKKNREPAKQDRPN